MLRRCHRWQVSGLSIFITIDASREHANHRRDGVAIVCKCVVSNHGVVRSHERNWITYLRRIDHNLRLRAERQRQSKMLTRKTMTLLHASS